MGSRKILHYTLLGLISEIYFNCKFLYTFSSPKLVQSSEKNAMKISSKINLIEDGLMEQFSQRVYKAIKQRMLPAFQFHLQYGLLYLLSLTISLESCWKALPLFTSLHLFWGNSQAPEIGQMLPGLDRSGCP